MKNILITDDDQSIRLLFKEVLTSAGYHVVEAGNGREAIKIITKEPIDLLILDIKMPDVHGVEALQRIRSRKKNLPVIVCTAYKHMKDDVTIQTSDVAAFLTKPVDINELTKTVKGIIGD